MSLVADLEINDLRVEFIAEYVLKTMRLKPDKWMKLYNLEDNKQLIMDYFEKPELFCLLINANSAGVLSITYDWPTGLKTKSCYFIKKSRDPIAKDTTQIRNLLLYGDLADSPVDQLSAFVDEVCSIQSIYVILID